VIGAAGQVYDLPGSWHTSLVYRHQHSERRFVGDQEQPDPHVAVNDLNVFDLSLSYTLTSRFSLGLNVPILEMNREQSVRAGQTFGDRFSTQSHGLGDVSVIARGWLFDPAKNLRHNVNTAIGVKIPTGQDDVTDRFQTFTGSVVLTVDQSIQPGDGGWGIRLGASAFQTLGNSFELFSTVDYLSNPEGTNGVPTYRPRASEGIMSVPDQYLARLGIQAPIWPKWQLRGTLVGRIEGVPAHDLIGSSTGFRRPGYAVSIEPGLNMTNKANTVFISVPLAIYRNRTKSVPDEIDDPIPTTLGNGDAAFADYLLLMGYTRTF